LEVLDLKVEEVACVMDTTVTVLRNILQRMIDPDSEPNGNADFHPYVMIGKMMIKHKNGTLYMCPD
jgi:hypothetical protein